MELLLLLLDGTLLPPVLLQPLIQQLSAVSCRRLSPRIVHPASPHPDLFSQHISVHSRVAEVLQQSCAGRQLTLTLAWPAPICTWQRLAVWKNLPLVLFIEIRLWLRLGLRSSSLWLGC